MKKIKKLVAIALAAVMVMAMGTFAMAATTTSSEDKGSIIINGLEEGVTASAYQIAKATYDSDGNFLGYEMTVTTSENGFKINADGSYDEATLTEANLAALWSAVSSTTASGTAKVDMGATAATISNLPVGSYLIVITGSESVAYGMMIGSVSYDVGAQTGDWTIDNGSISVSDCELWAKAATPTLTKTEHHAGGNDTHGESTNVGDEITFDITITPIPSYEGDYPEFDVDDTLTGLTISENELNSLTVKIMNGEDTVATLVKDTDYTVTPVGDEAPYTEFDVNFVVDGKYTLNAYAVEGYTIVIEYPATVADTAEYTNGEHEYDNDAVLTYATTSYVSHDGKSNEGTSEDKDYEYTFALNAYKTDGTKTDGVNYDALAGATFALYTDEECSTAYTRDDEAVTATSGEDGTIAFSGLAEGTYYMKETEAPSGYLLNQSVYKVVISASYDESGMITTWSIVITDEKGTQVGSATQSASTGLTIINTKTGILPSMGGRGTLIITLIGCAIVVCAIAGVAVTRRRRAA